MDCIKDVEKDVVLNETIFIDEKTYQQIKKNSVKKMIILPKRSLKKLT